MDKCGWGGREVGECGGGREVGECVGRRWVSVWGGGG